MPEPFVPPTFPDRLPADEMRIIAAAIVTRSVDKSLLFPAWVVQGYLEGLYVSEGSRLASPGIAEPTDHEAAEMLRGMVGDDRRVGASPLPGVARVLVLAVARLVVRVLEA